MAAGLSRAPLGKEVRSHAVSPDTYRSVGFPAANEPGNMFQFNAEFSDEYCAARDIDETRMLNPELPTFDDWREENVSKIPIKQVMSLRRSPETDRRQ